MNRQKITVIIPAAGKGSRSGLNQNKIFFNLVDQPIILKTVKIFDDLDKIDEIIVVCADQEIDKIKEILLPAIKKPIKFVCGGKTRFLSVKNALQFVNEGIVLIHDGARPDLSQTSLNKLIKSALTTGSGVLGGNLTETILETDGRGNVINSTRKNRQAAKTPQAFDVLKLKRAYELAGNGEDFTDDAGVYCSFIGKCTLVLGEDENKKYTYPSDFLPSSATTRIGTGIDLHKLTENRKLILGGVEIPHDKGLLGHSDADVLLHAIMDALLSSASLRDIGYYFSDKDPHFKDVSSMSLLEKVLEMLNENNVKLVYLSAVVMAERPKLNAYHQQILSSLSKALNLPENKIGLTFTTLEGIGTVGREEGIASQAYVLCADM